MRSDEQETAVKDAGKEGTGKSGTETHSWPRKAAPEGGGEKGGWDQGLGENILGTPATALGLQARRKEIRTSLRLFSQYNRVV